MSNIDVSSSVSSVLSNNSKVLALETTLQHSIVTFRELVLDMEQLHIESESYKTMFLTQKEKCESKSCSSSETLMKIIEAKDNILQLLASTLTRLNETKNFNILNEAFKILFSEPAEIKLEPETKPLVISPKKELNSSLEDVSYNEESISEIEGTPTGRSSPIIQTKKLKSLMDTPSDHRDKKKCPQNWITPESKSMKLVFPTTTRSGKPGGRGGKTGCRMVQSRLKAVKQKQNNIVDLTCSPEFSGGSRTGKNVGGDVQPLIIKKEPIENEDTILPSPTSGPTNFVLFKSTKGSPMKFKKPLSLKPKSENNIKNESKLDIQNIENRCTETTVMNDTHGAEDSINILSPNRLPNFLKDSPPKREPHNDTTYCDTQSSVSVLHNVDQLEDNINVDIKYSPRKRPLAENINVINKRHSDDLESSLSLLQGESKTNAVTNVKRKIPELVEIVYKEPTVRKKAEKLMLQGWSCDECKQFFGELYKDDPEMYAKKIDECSKHRGKFNPARPKTPPNFWNPRWEVPNNTEEFNRKNNIT